MKQLGRYPSLASKYECTGCLACVASCKQNAIKRIIDPEGHIAVSINDAKCIGCKLCEKICEQVRCNYGCNNLQKSRVFYGWSNNELYRKEGTSGGIFASISKFVIQNGGVVVSAYFDGMRCHHTIIDDVSKIHLFQGSVYTQSDMTDAYRLINENIFIRKIAFFGTGCQVSAIATMFSNNTFYGNLLLVDIVCGGVPSTILIDKFLEYNKKYDGIAEYRNKDKYMLTAHSKGKKEVVNCALPLEGFVGEMTNRYSCYDCKFAYAHRISDITIGDLWNYDIEKNEHKNGISMMITHSDSGLEILNQIDVTRFDCSWKNVLPYNRRIVYGNSPIFKPRIELEKNINRLSYKEFERLYGVKMKPWNLREYFFKIYRHFKYRSNLKQAKKYITELLKEE